MILEDLRRQLPSLEGWERFYTEDAVGTKRLWELKPQFNPGHKHFMGSGKTHFIEYKHCPPEVKDMERVKLVALDNPTENLFIPRYYDEKRTAVLVEISRSVKEARPNRFFSEFIFDALLWVMNGARPDLTKTYEDTVRKSIKVSRSLWEDAKSQLGVPKRSGGRFLNCVLEAYMNVK